MRLLDFDSLPSFGRTVVNAFSHDSGQSTAILALPRLEATVKVVSNCHAHLTSPDRTVKRIETSATATVLLAV